jgi:hypothetical protein
MPRKTPSNKRPVGQYDHKAKKRANNPPVVVDDRGIESLKISEVP